MPEISRKFIESKQLDDIEVLTDTGWSDIKNIMKTIQYDEYHCIFEDYEIKCADTHIFFDKNFHEVYAKDLKIYDSVQTEKGLKKLLSKVKTGNRPNMYDLELGDDNHRYYTNGILSHNSTLLKYIFDKSKKNVAIVAPTGIAAINIGGQTIHSFFRLPPGNIKDKDIPFLGTDPMYNPMRILDILIIDEISMVRSDMMDNIDKSLRKNRGCDIPFGGVQVLMFGDLNQLPPVVTEDDAQIMAQYKSPYFFDSKILSAYPPKKLMLTQIFRQKDPHFIDVLNRIKENKITVDDLNEVNNKCYVANYTHLPEVINLCTVNRQVDMINEKMLSEVKTPSFKFTGVISGEFKFNNNNLPVPMDLHIKEGCRVLFRHNDKDKRWCNGSLGTILEIKNDYIKILLDDGYTHHVTKVVWEYKKNRYNKLTAKMEPTVVGTYTHYPFILGYAISVHKCIEENQLVKVNGGWKPIKDIQKGDYVLSHTGDNKKIKDKIFSGIKDCYKIKTKHGFELIGTFEHPVLLKNGIWKKIGDINIGDIIININEGSKEKTIKDDFSYLMGYLCGDGCYSGSKQNDKYKIEIAFNKHDKDLINNIDNILKNMNCNVHHDNFETSKNRYRIRIHDKILRNKLLEAGLDYVIGANKRVPHSILMGTLSQKASFISGYFDSDGSCNEKMLRTNNISHEMLKQIQLILLDLNIGSTINQMAKTKYTKNIAYSLRIVNSDLKKFKEKIGFKSNYKNNNLLRLCEKYGNHNRSQYWVCKDENIRKNIQNIIKHIPDANLRKIRNTLRTNIKNLNSVIIKNVVEYTDANNIKIDNYIRQYGEFKRNHDEIISIEYVGENPVYDIEVEDNHSFVSQGFICHNSQGCTFEKMHLDLVDGCFASGQCYTAISRVTSLEGLTLARPINKSDIILDERIKIFLNI